MPPTTESDVDTSTGTGSAALEKHIKSATCLLQRPWDATLDEWIEVAAAVMGSGITASEVHLIFVEVAAIVREVYKRPDVIECFSDPSRLSTLSMYLADMEKSMQGQVDYLTIKREKFKDFKRHIYRGILWEAAQTFNWWYYKDTRRRGRIPLTPLNPLLYYPRGSGSSPTPSEVEMLPDTDKAEAEVVPASTLPGSETGKSEMSLHQAAIRTANQTGIRDTPTSIPTIAETLESLKVQIRSRDEEFAKLNQQKEKMVRDLERELAAKIARNQRLEAELAEE